MPKGVMISHDNMLWNTKRYLQYSTQEKAKEVVISYMPLCHVAGQVDIFYAILSAGTVHFGDRNALKGTIMKTVLECRPTLFGAVPRLYEKIHERVQVIFKTNAINASPRVAEWAEKVSLEHHMGNSSGFRKTTWKYGFAQTIIFNRVKRCLGLDRCKIFRCAGAPLKPELKKYFLGMDLPVMDVYGMTESCGQNNMSMLNAFRMNSVGKTLPGSETRVINPDSSGHGEICIRGRNVFMGYIWDVKNTQETLDEDGWLHTGDLGHVDEEGFVYITGRMKELIITKGGENIPPAHVEHLVKDELPCVSNAFLIGDHRKYLAMLISLKVGFGLFKLCGHFG